MSYLLRAGVVVSVLSTSALAQGLKLNPRLAAPKDGDVGLFALTENPPRALYLADQDEDGVTELFVVPTDRIEPPRQLSAPLAVGGDVASFLLSADGAYAVYVADQVADNVYGIFGVRTDGLGSPVDLSGGLPRPILGAIATVSGRVLFWHFESASSLTVLHAVGITGTPAAIELNGGLQMRSIERSSVSPDGTRAVFAAELPSSPADVRLFSVPLDGSQPPVQLAPLDPDAYDFSVTPDSTRVVFLSTGLFSRPIDGSASAVRLDGAIVPGREVTNFLVSADSTRVVYTSDENAATVSELFSAPIDGASPAQRLNPPFAADRDVLFITLRLSAAGRVLYVADQDAADVFELYSVPSDASASAVKLNPALGGALDVVQGDFSTDGQTVVYRADQSVDGVVELYRVPSDGSLPAVKLNGPIVGGSSGVSEFQITADDETVLYLAEQDTLGVPELYRVPLDAGSAAVRVHDPLAAPGRVYSGFRAGSDGDDVVYRARVDAADVQELFAAPPDGSHAPLTLNGSLASGPVVGDVHVAAFAGDERYVYLAEGDTAGTLELYSVAIESPPAFVKLNGPLVANGSLLMVRVSPDGTRVVYLASQEHVGVNELYSVPSDGSAPAVKLNPALVAGGDVAPPFGSLPVADALALDPTGARVVYLADQYVDEDMELFSVPIDGSAPAVLVSGAHVPGSDVLSFQISSDGAWVVYEADDDVDGDFELYRAPLDGSANPVRLVPGVDLQVPLGNLAYRLSADDARVVYQRSSGGVVELYSVPAGGGPSVKLNGALVAGGSVHDATAPAFALSPDSSRVVYRADQFVDERFELFSVPIDGSASPVVLNLPLAGARDVTTDFHISPDSTRVVYVADQLVDLRNELFSVPLDGSAPAVKLNGPMPPGGNVDAGGAPALRISADSSRVVYRADELANGRFELFVAPLDGSATSARASSALVAGGDVTASFEFSRDGRQLIYQADAFVDESFEFLARPVDRLQGAKRLTGAMPSGGALHAFTQSPNGQRVIYIAEQDDPNVAELYLSFLTRAHRAR
jgi:Tol biopolymer transport system component